MYQKVLVPLDRSEVAECSLKHVKKLAKAGLVGEVILLNVIEIPASWVTEHTDLADLQQKQIIVRNKYLAGIKAQLEAEGVQTRTELLSGSAEQMILSFAKGNGVDLIIIASHGHTGIKEWVFGNVALRVLHDAHVPVLIIRPEAC